MMCVTHSVMERQRHNNPLNPRYFYLQRPKRDGVHSFPSLLGRAISFRLSNFGTLDFLKQKNICTNIFISISRIKFNLFSPIYSTHCLPRNYELAADGDSVYTQVARPIGICALWSWLRSYFSVVQRPRPCLLRE